MGRADRTAISNYTRDEYNYRDRIDGFGSGQENWRKATGTPNRLTVALKEAALKILKAAESGETPLAFLERLMNDESLSLALRLEAAKAAKSPIA